ncbi:MAG: 50S ribosomal protein L11 methyltransferase [Bacteroidales bacterium]|nr:50S ribosomal protein L11 methyltransferase [Candidatus Physcousia equi]
MKYFELSFHLTPYSETAADVLSALLADAGCESFMPNEEEKVLLAYVQTNAYDEKAIEELLEFFPMTDVDIRFDKKEAEDRDWNEAWEEEGFEPIVVDDRLAVCDTKHERPDTELCILIHPRQAFGTGSHQTTRMLLTQLLEMPLEGRKVVDAGCGTGILGFLCLMRGAAALLAYDIDEWSVENTLLNASLNPTVEAGRMEVRLGDAAVLADTHDADLLIANINRNILVGEMPRYVAALKSAPQTRLLLSGFYEQDIAFLLEHCAPFGLEVETKRTDGEWAMLVMRFTQLS